MVYKLFNKQATGSGTVKDENMQNKELAEELKNPLLENLKTKSTLIFYRCSRYAIIKEI